MVKYYYFLELEWIASKFLALVLSNSMAISSRVGSLYSFQIYIPW